MANRADTHAHTRAAGLTRMQRLSRGDFDGSLLVHVQMLAKVGRTARGQGMMIKGLGFRGKG